MTEQDKKQKKISKEAFLAIVENSEKRIEESLKEFKSQQQQLEEMVVKLAEQKENEDDAASLKEALREDKKENQNIFED